MSQEVDSNGVIFLVICLYFFFRWMRRFPSDDPKKIGERTGGVSICHPFTGAAFDAAAPPGASMVADDESRRALSAIRAADPSFDITHFLHGAEIAYEAVLVAFAQSDTHALADLASAEVFSQFAVAIAERERHDNQVIFALAKIDAVAIVNVVLEDQTASVTVRFSSQFITHGREGSGDASQNAGLVAAKDEWTFARRLTSGDPNWKLMATRSA